jgi:hypothetical protein
MNDTPSTPEDELEEDLELTADESDDVAGGAEIKFTTASKFSPSSTLTQKVSPTISTTEVAGDGSV